MAFSKWTELDKEALSFLAPDLGIRNWDQIDLEQRELIWKHITNKGWISADKVTFKAIYDFGNAYKVSHLCKNTTSHGGPHYENSRSSFREIKDCCFKPALLDFKTIFLNEDQGSVYELLSFYVNEIDANPYTYGYKDGKKYFSNCFNDISNQFGLNVLLGENCFVIKQDERIIEDIYKPVLSYLSDSKWLPVNRDLAEANKAYLKATDEDYSRSITLTISALQAFLQILVKGTTGKGDIGDLIKEGQKLSLIPSDAFSTKILKDIEATLMRERQSKGDAHPKEVYGDEKTARLALNISMIFIQHCF